MAKRNLTGAIVAGVLCVGLAGAVFAQQSNDEVIAKRRAAMSQAGSAQGGIRAVANSATSVTPEQHALLKGAAEKLVAAFDQVKDPAMWPKGSGLPEVAAGTKAKAEIWADEAGFKAAMDASVAAAAKVKSAVDGGDVAQMKAAAGAMQGTCGGCHTKYRT